MAMAMAMAMATAKAKVREKAGAEGRQKRVTGKEGWTTAELVNTGLLAGFPPLAELCSVTDEPEDSRHSRGACCGSGGDGWRAYVWWLSGMLMGSKSCGARCIGSRADKE
jgi:hypothetical protein